MANILIIAYDYPPILSPEAIQVQRRALTLARNENKVYVLTVHKHPAFEFIDTELFVEENNIHVIHTQRPLLEKFFNVIFSLINLTGRKFWWKFYALKPAKKIIKEKKIDIIYTHSTPLVDHFIGLKMKTYFENIKWIAHFSDPWSLNPYESYRFNWQKKLNKKFEEKILMAADLITLTSTKTKEMFNREFAYVKNKIKVLPHTFDPNLQFEGFKTKQNKIIVHTGNIYGERTIKYLLDAVRDLNLKHIEFHFYGKMKADEVRLIQTLGLERIVKVYGQVTYLESLQIILQADYLLLIDAPLAESPFFPSKLADYIGALKPIIALTPWNSATRDILRDVGNDHLMASSDNIEEISHVLCNLDSVESNFKNISSYSMENFTLLKEVFCHEE